MEVVTAAIPVENMIRRWENHIAMFERELAALPWWKFKRRWAYRGTIAAYRFEIMALERLGGAHVLNQILERTPD